MDTQQIKQAVTTDDAGMFIARLKNGAMGLFETSRVSIGYKNALAQPDFDALIIMDIKSDEYELIACPLFIRYQQDILSTLASYLCS